MPKQHSPSWRRFLPVFLIAFFSLNVNAQKTVTGKVTGGKDNKPLVGATVLVKGSTNGTQTEPDGSFKINVPAENSTLIVSAIGYEVTQVSTK